MTRALDWSLVSREALEKLAQAMMAHSLESGAFEYHTAAADQYNAAVAALREAAHEATPRRTRAEVDAELGELLRAYYRHVTRPGWKAQADWDSLGAGVKQDLNRLCSEPIKDGDP